MSIGLRLQTYLLHQVLVQLENDFPVELLHRLTERVVGAEQFQFGDDED